MNKPRVTIADVAQHANVSKMTVSRVINNKGEISEPTRQKILRVMDELGYRPNHIARSLATNTTLRIGIVVPSIANTYFGSIVEGAESVFWENDYHILLGHTGSNPTREGAVLEMFDDQRVDGVIVLSAHSSRDEMTHYLRSQRAAVVINTPVKAGVARRIYTDELKSMAMTVDHLLKRGRRNIGYIRFGINTYAHHERYRGLQLALQAAGVEFNESRQMITLQDNTPSMYEGAVRLLQQYPEIDALIGFNSGIAATFLRACAQFGRRVPDDIAVIGYDDIFISELTVPSLTTVELTTPKEEVGAMAAHMLLEQIANGDSPRDDVILEHKLIIRDSAP